MSGFRVSARTDNGLRDFEKPVVRHGGFGGPSDITPTITVPAPQKEAVVDADIRVFWGAVASTCGTEFFVPPKPWGVQKPGRWRE